VPVVSLGAAAHVVAGTPTGPHALRALEQAMGFAPRLVEHDLLLALTLLHGPERADA
jgi:hypothetical protein